MGAGYFRNGESVPRGRKVWVEQPVDPGGRLGRGVAAGKTAEQEAELINRQKRRDPETIKKMEREQALQGVYPEVLIPGLGRVFGRGAAAGRATKATRQEPKVPSGGAAKPRNEPTLAPKPATKEVPKPKKTRNEDDEAISRFEGESGAIRSGLRPGKKRFRKDDDPMGRFGGESPSYMSKGGKVQKAPSPPDMGSSKYEPDLNKPKPKKKAMADDMDMFMARSGGLAKKIDGIALRGKTRGKMY